MTYDGLKNQLKGLAGRIDAMSLRERALIFVTLLVALYFLAVNVLFGPLNAEKDRWQQQVSLKRQETRALETQVQVLVTTGGGSAQRTKITALRENLKTMDMGLARVTAGLVPPKEMARLIEQMLLKNRGLRVMKMESLPAAPLLEGGSVGGGGTMVYKHGMQIELKGGYLDVLRYLQSLEALPWKIFWGKVALKTEKYPDSRVSLLVYTLSTHEAWIGL